MGIYASNYHQEHERLSLPSRPCWLLLVQHAVAWEAEADDAMKLVKDIAEFKAYATPGR